MLWPKERQLHVRVSTEIFWNEGLESKAKIPMKQWTHITVSISGQMIILYINGTRDSQIILDGKIVMNNGPFHLGKDPWRSGVKCYIDDLKIYNSMFNENEIQHEAINANLLISPFYVNLGCEFCTYTNSNASCGNNYHLCSYSELYSGAYLIARKNGLFKTNQDVWAKEENSDDSSQTNQNISALGDTRRMGLCCHD